VCAFSLETVIPIDLQKQLANNFLNFHTNNKLGYITKLHEIACDKSPLKAKSKDAMELAALASRAVVLLSTTISPKKKNQTPSTLLFG
jgi:hypothetical protein